MPNQSNHKTEQLLQKANTLPTTPGVYIMRDASGRVIYVGKSKKLKNRVTQYFQNNKKNIKTAKMVSKVADFDYILCKTEIEALSLENTLIKQYAPKYNIKLKDAKSYPYIKITAEPYPKILFTRTRLADRAKYFGPFSGVSTVYSILDILHKSLGIPNCKRKFPQDIGKERPCIYYQMKQCCGVCTGTVSTEEYDSFIRCAIDILRGHTNQAIETLKKQMNDLAEEERFEAAARCRDTILALKQLSQKQHVVASPDTNADVFGVYHHELNSCVSVLYIREGLVVDKADFVFSGDAMTDSDSMSAFLVEHYMLKNDIPKTVFCSFPLEEDDILATEAFLEHRATHKTEVRHPERGKFRELCQIAIGNAEEKVKQANRETEANESVLIHLGQLLGMETVPERIEAYDISNIGAEHITAGMVVFENGKSKKSDYRSFKIQSVEKGTDDYASMKEALRRRFCHLREDQSGSFAQYPDLILVDGGKGHVSVALEAMDEEGFAIPVFGMVKDDYHKTRALCTAQEEINIGRDKPIFMLIYKIQEEVHRFTVGRTTQAKRSTLKHSSLEKIEGIGPQKAKKLLGAMGTLSAIKNASAKEIEAISGISRADALRIYRYYHTASEGEENAT